MLSDLPDTLQTFFYPQVEQLAMRETRAEFGGCAVLPEKTGEGYLWVASLGPHCLLSVHDFMLNEEVPLVEYPESSFALCLMTTNMAHLAPVPPFRAEGEENVIAFRQPDGTTRFTMPKRSRCHSTTLCFLPEYFDYASSITGADPDQIKKRFEHASPNGLPPSIRRCLRALAPKLRGDDGTALRYASLALESLSLMMESADVSVPSREVELVRQALEIMEAHLAERVTLDDVAGRLFVSRSTLCKAFRDVEGCGVLEKLSRLRMERASELLRGSDLAVADIATAVGFAHQSSFCAAFKRTFGLSPSQVRSREGVVAFRGSGERW